MTESKSVCGVTDHDGRVCTLADTPNHAHDWQFCHEESSDCKYGEYCAGLGAHHVGEEE